MEELRGTHEKGQRTRDSGFDFGNVCFHRCCLAGRALSGINLVEEIQLINALHHDHLKIFQTDAEVRLTRHVKRCTGSPEADRRVGGGVRNGEGCVEVAPESGFGG